MVAMKLKNTRRCTICPCITYQNGNIIVRPKSTDLRLSDCKPILASNGDILWYVTDNTRPILYSLNPYSEQAYLADAKIPMI